MSEDEFAPRSNREKLRLRLSESSDRELRAIVESTASTELEREIAREVLAGRGARAIDAAPRADGRAHALDAAPPVRPDPILRNVGVGTAIVIALLVLRVIVRLMVD